MTVRRSSRFFKFLTVAFVVVFIILTATRQRISDTVETDDNGKSFLGQIREKLFNQSEDINIFNSNETLTKDAVEENAVAIEEDLIPFDDTMPGAYLRLMDPAPVNKSYCKYNYQFPYDLVYTSKDYLFPPQLGRNSYYRIIYNVTEAHDFENVAQVTYATHMTSNFAYFIPELLRRWDGLITVAAFVPDLDVAFFLKQINDYCYCEPEMHRVSVHIVTQKLLPFSKKDIYFDRPDNCIPDDSSKIGIYKDYDETVVYPVNVLRNAARTSALTKYVINSDIELMPSKDMAKGFLEMIQKSPKGNPREVFVIPIFEVEATEPIPENKEELMKLLDEKKAVYFHGMVCKHCQNFPGIEDWMKRHSKQVGPLVTIKRHKPYDRWEPLFIGTNQEPLYSEELSWEGLQDKMTQSLEMCLQDYDFTVLDNVFLCHWPGIKKQKIIEEEWRADYVAKNKEAYMNIIEDLKKRYDDIKACNLENYSAQLPEKKKKKPK